MDTKVRSVYKSIMDDYVESDETLLFGESTGAFTASVRRIVNTKIQNPLKTPL